MRAKILLLTFMTLFTNVLVSEAQNDLNPGFKRGFAGQVEAGTLFHEGFAGEYVNLSTGYIVLPGLFVGIGVGVKNQSFNTVSSTKSLHVPTFAHLRYSFLNKTISPFIDLKGGMVSDVSGSIKSMPSSSPDYGCGHFFRIGAGVDYKRYSIYIGDDWAQLSYNNFDASWSDYAWTVGVAVRF